ncbi:MAG: hypothetical protein FJ271_03555 [Planctomycetes bacterium]|nr:hypothetical protein [Planctomycetota bacterium]
MPFAASVFLEFNLPNGTTWFYFSFLLAIALFFKFGRVLSFRNLDVILMFLLVPGFLLLLEAKPNVVLPEREPALAAARLVAVSAGTSFDGGASAAVASTFAADPLLFASSWLWWGYLWLLAGSAILMIRCLVDLALVSRPALTPNLTLGGLAWFAGALFVCLMAVAFRPERTQGGSVPPPHKSVVEKQAKPIGPETTALALAQGSLESALRYWSTRSLAVLCHLAVVIGLVVIGYRHFQDASAGMAAATFYLMLPYTGMHVGQAHHVWPMALVVWAIAAYRMPRLSGMLLGLASVTAYVPALLLPIWISFYWRRGVLRFLSGYLFTVGLGLAAIALVIFSMEDLSRILREGLSLAGWQPWRVPTTEGFWTGVHWAYRIPIFIAYLAFVITTAFWPAPKSLAHVIALSAAVLIGIQFWYADQGGVYVLWYLPLLMLMVFRPNLSDRRPALLQTDADWFGRTRRLIGKLTGRLAKPSDMPIKAA